MTHALLNDPHAWHLAAWCESCDWSSSGPTPYADAIAHRRLTGHVTMVDQEEPQPSS